MGDLKHLVATIAISLILNSEGRAQTFASQAADPCQCDCTCSGEDSCGLVDGFDFILPKPDSPTNEFSIVTPGGPAEIPLGDVLLDRGNSIELGEVIEELMSDTPVDESTAIRNFDPGIDFSSELIVEGGRLDPEFRQEMVDRITNERLGLIEQLNQLESFGPDDTIARPVDPIIGGGVGGEITDIRRYIQNDPELLGRCYAAAEPPTELVLGCAAAVRNLCETGCSLETLLSRLISNDSNVRNELEIYDGACLDHSYRSDLSTSISGRFDLDYIFERTGVLHISTPPDDNSACRRWWEEVSRPEYFCTGTAVNGRYLLTARHCFFERRRRDTWSGARACIADGLVSFRTFSSPNVSHPVEGIYNEQKVRADQSMLNDYAYLKLGETNGVFAGVVQVTEPLWYESALIVGPHLLVENSAPPAVPEWRGQVRWGRNDCRIVRQNDRCIATKCQTIGGFSGAPVWVSREAEGGPRMALAGIQIIGGATEETLESCGFSDDLILNSEQANIAITKFRRRN